ncbi:hypothetical protein SNEBB_004663 [Seison nebaliae]|nr:hypothetical protein SNEBB_004663 [Seison nebaliae]
MQNISNKSTNSAIFYTHSLRNNSNSPRKISNEKQKSVISKRLTDIQNLYSSPRSKKSRNYSLDILNKNYCDPPKFQELPQIPVSSRHTTREDYHNRHHQFYYENKNDRIRPPRSVSRQKRTKMKSRRNDVVTDMNKAIQMIYEACKRMTPPDRVFTRTIIHYNEDQLNQIQKEFQIKYSLDVYRELLKVLGNDFRPLLNNSFKPKEVNLVHTIYESLYEPDYAALHITEIVSLRNQKEVKFLKNIYLQTYGKPLEAEIEDKMEGELCRFILAILNTERFPEKKLTKKEINLDLEKLKNEKDVTQGHLIYILQNYSFVNSIQLFNAYKSMYNEDICDSVAKRCNYQQSEFYPSGGFSHRGNETDRRNMNPQLLTTQENEDESGETVNFARALRSYIQIQREPLKYFAIKLRRILRGKSLDYGCLSDQISDIVINIRKKPYFLSIPDEYKKLKKGQVTNSKNGVLIKQDTSLLEDIELSIPSQSLSYVICYLWDNNHKKRTI